MSEEALQPVIKGVQEALSKYVKKPPLSEKFLKKPPFRYLHDIVNAVIRETGFLDGVFTSDELDSNNVKDKESKIAFLSKLISAVKTASGKSVSARPAKIAAGLEVEKTLELLQIIGQTIDHSESNLIEASAPQTVSTKPSKNDAADKPKENIQNGHRREKVETAQPVQNSRTVEKVEKIEKTPSESTKQKRFTAGDKSDHGKRTAVSRRESLKKEPQSSTVSNDARKGAKIEKAKKESVVKDDIPGAGREAKVIGAATKTSKENSISSRRSSIQNSTATARKSSLKDSNRKAIEKKIRSVVIKEEREEEPHVATSVEKLTTKSKNVGQESNETKMEADEPTPAKSSTELNSVTASKPDVPEKPDGIQTETNRPKESTAAAVQRPTSARPGSRKLPRAEAAVSNNDDNNTAEHGVTKDNNSSANNSSGKIRAEAPIRPRTANRPPSARPGAPKIRDRGEVAVPEETIVAAAPVNVFEEGTQDQFADDKDDIVIIEPEQAPVAIEERVQIDDAEQGQLVHQILKTQKELNESVVDVSQNRHLEIEWEAGRQREKDIVTKETERIRTVIQVLTSAANPLGKLFDFLQEDVDEMQRELQHWKNVSEKYEKQQQVEQELKKQSLQPLRKQLQDVEASIEDEYRQIASIKASILANDEKIIKLTSGPASHHQTRTRVK